MFPPSFTRRAFRVGVAGRPQLAARKRVAIHGLVAVEPGCRRKLLGAVDARARARGYRLFI
jgi:hypothetical protein